MCEHTRDPGQQMLPVVCVGCHQTQPYLPQKGLPLWALEGTAQRSSVPRQDGGASF